MRDIDCLGASIVGLGCLGLRDLGEVAGDLEAEAAGTRGGCGGPARDAGQLDATELDPDLLADQTGQVTGGEATATR